MLALKWASEQFDEVPAAEFWVPAFQEILRGSPSTEIPDCSWKSEIISVRAFAGADDPPIHRSRDRRILLSLFDATFML
ncbi:MAG TPA: hypothetical protein VN641_01685 [Urbifossiella sp.]|nr:hypothetical protein [Urbifossiella sp.]